MTFIEKFESLKKKLMKADVSKLTEQFAFQVNMTDEDCGGIFYIAYINGVFAVEPYDYCDRTALLTGLSADIAKLSSGKVAVQVEGNMGQVEMLAKAYEKPPVKRKTVTKKKPAAAKAAKPAAKKETAVKTEAPAAKKAEKTVAVKTEKPAAVSQTKPEAKTKA